MRAELVHFTLVDAGAELDLRRVPLVLGASPAAAPMVSRAPAPAYAEFPNPLEAIQAGPGTGRIEARVHPLGVVTVRLRVVVEAASLQELRLAANGPLWGGKTLAEAAQPYVDQVLGEVRGASIEPYSVRSEPERYLAYCIQGENVERLLTEHAADLAAVVADEAPGVLVPDRQRSALKHTVRYSHGDAAILGWDNAILLGNAGSFEDILDVLELANLELLEFRTYDAYLDQRLDASFETLDRLWAPGGLFRSARSVLREISALRVDFARLTDNLHDTGKLFGDWYLATVHQRLHERFHLQSWERAVAAKMETLEDMFHLAEEEANHRRAIFLESMIVVLFILDLVLIFLTAK